MIKLNLYSGQAAYLHHDAIARVVEAPASAQWHGINAYVTTFDGETLEVNDRAYKIADMVAAARKESTHGS